MARTKSIDNITLAAGAHRTRSHGVCFMEAVAWIAQEKHSDHPACACPVFGEFARRWNDRLEDEDRQKMKPYLVMSIGTACDGFQDRRGWMIIDWSVREALAIYCEARNLKDFARDVRALPEIRDWDTAKQAGDILRSLALDRALDLDLDLDLARARALALDLDLDLDRALDRALALDRDLDRALALDLDRALALFNESGFALLDRLLTISLDAPQLQGGAKNTESMEVQHA